MSANYVKVYYGPHDSFYTVSHRPQKLRGLKEKLQKLGFRVDLVPVEFINCCVLEMSGHEITIRSKQRYDLESIHLLFIGTTEHGVYKKKVFRCNIKNLSFNSSCDLDPVCRRAVAAVLDSSVKFHRARSYLWSWALLEEQIFRRSEYLHKDYWPFAFESSNTCDDCVCLKK